MRKSNRPPEPGTRGLLRLTCPLLRQGVRYISPRSADVHRLPLRGYDLA